MYSIRFENKKVAGIPGHSQPIAFFPCDEYVQFKSVKNRNAKNNI